MNSPASFPVSSPPAIQHVLIVEQQDMIRTILCTLLQSWGFTTHTACNLIGACRMVFSDGPFDAIICNYDLPDGDAFDLVDWMIDHQLEVPTVVPFGTIKPMSEAPGNVRLVPKPFDPDEIRNAIESARRDMAKRSARPRSHRKRMQGGLR